MEWQLADAKNRFSELVSRALSEGPQRVKRRNDAVVVLADAEYERLTGNRPGFKHFLLHGPDLSGLDLSRDRSPMRDVNMEGDKGE
ncbi:type II toxin-antitoxin system prevent-host-death family antitoxin [Acidicapsa dinghuensis]|uniref:Antitoxin n=1 Tax=Acidicapsa dinghuensis TaxID=2218256 RepID=A0ABW1ECN1_9BACT|nr:type II toxin-antitoxin system prevent-host-death family antitoxin [Acidicapsa dinghuensis]